MKMLKFKELGGRKVEVEVSKVEEIYWFKMYGSPRYSIAVKVKGYGHIPVSGQYETLAEVNSKIKEMYS